MMVLYSQPDEGRDRIGIEDTVKAAIDIICIDYFTPSRLPHAYAFARRWSAQFCSAYMKAGETVQREVEATLLPEISHILHKDYDAAEKYEQLGAIFNLNRNLPKI